MTNPLINWWRSSQFRSALKQGNLRAARDILQQIETSGAKLSWLEELFKKQLKTEESLAFYRQEVASFSKRLNLVSDNKLTPDAAFIDFIHKSLKLIEHDEGKLQCTGIEERVFDDFEANLAYFIDTELEKISPGKLKDELNKAIEDLEGLKQGIDPNYNFKLSAYVYLLKYFPENVYCAYLAWFLIYEAGLLPDKIKILDIGAGPGTIVYGLALLLNSSSGFFPPPKMHISYYSFEQQDLLQFRGLQFWRKYIEPQQTATNVYFRFDTNDIFDYSNNSKKLPEAFFDFIVVSHCFFYQPQQLRKSHKIYSQMFANHLAPGGYVLLIVQGRKLFSSYDVVESEDISQEEKVISMFLAELKLKLEWYKFVTSTGKRKAMGKDFVIFARENLSPQKYISPLQQQYLGQKYISNYAIDDYIILARR